MPVTPAHAVVALPFVRARRWSAAAITCGAVAPDLPLYVSGGAGYGVTHELWAVPTLDVLLGLGCLWAWWALMRPGLVAVLPAPARARVPAPRRFPVALLPVGVALGALTHVVWDAFTHPGRVGSVLLPALAERYGPFAGTAWLQYGCGAAGIGVLLGAAVVAYRRAAPRSGADSELGTLARPVAALDVALVLIVAVVVAAAVLSAPGPSPIAHLAFAELTLVLPAVAAVLALTGLAVRSGAGRARAPATGL